MILLNSIKVFLLVWVMIFPFGSSSHYETLGIKKTANDKDIKKAYRTLALKWHPDKAPEKERDEATKQFQKISEAYEVLSDSEQRKKYDLMSDESEPQQDPFSGGHPFGGNTGSRSGGWKTRQTERPSGSAQQQFKHRKPEDVFKDFFGTDSPFDNIFQNLDIETMMGGAGAGMSGGMPGMSGGMPGMSGGMPGMSGGMPGMSGGMPGMSGGMPGMSGGMPGMSGGMPNTGAGAQKRKTPSSRNKQSPKATSSKKKTSAPNQEKKSTKSTKQSRSSSSSKSKSTNQKTQSNEKTSKKSKFNWKKRTPK